MKPLTILSILTLTQFTHAQIGNEKDLIERNKVKSSVEKHCFLNDDGSCTIFYEEYDRQGNMIEWDMGRLGTIYRYRYAKNGNRTMTLWVDKTDTTQIDTFQHYYDQNNELIREIVSTDTTEYKQTYDENQRLIKTISETKNVDRNIVQEITTRNWTTFGKIKTEITTTEILEVARNNEYSKSSNSRIEYEYDHAQNLAKTTYYQADTISRTITCKYDAQNRLIEKNDNDPARAKRREIIFGNQDAAEIFKTTMKYLENGQIDELYTYFSDPCMSLDNHFLYKHHYLSNGLLDYADVYEDGRLVFTIKYEYDYYK